MTKTKWLTISEASLLAAEMGLDRTHKTIRSWCRKGDLIAEKQTTRTGDRWVADRDSLITKINFELEFKEQQARTLSEPVQTGSDRFEPVRTSSDQSGHVQTSANTFDGQKQGFQTGENPDEPEVDLSAQAEIKALKAKIMTLSIDVGWREEALKRLREDNEKGQETLHAQARYIGHLESDLMRLGGKPDQTFLSAPKPQESVLKSNPLEPEVVAPQRPLPDQGSFYENHSG